MLGNRREKENERERERGREEEWGGRTYYVKGYRGGPTGRKA